LEYAVLATSKSLTGKVLLGTFSLKAVNTGSGTLVFDSTIKNFSNATDGLMKAENTPSVSYTILSASSTVCTSGTKRCSQENAEVCKTDGSGWTVINCAGLGCDETTKECNKMDYVCTAGDKQCSGNILQKCNSNGTGWETDTNCGTLGCNNTTGECNTNTGTSTCTENDWSSTLSPTTCPASGQQTKTWTKSGTCTGGVTHPTTETVTCTVGAGSATVNIKLAFGGVKNNNGKCAKDNWLVKIKLVNSVENTVIDRVLTGYPTQTTSANSRGEMVYDFSVTVAGIPDAGISKSALFLTGPKHISVKYGENNQTRWYPELVGNLALNKGTNNYDLSNYPLLAGDINDDGKIDGRDYSYLKEKANNLIAAAAEGTIVDGDINGDCQANAGDVRLMMESLKEINGQTY